jgi:hypothetical protein
LFGFRYRRNPDCTVCHLPRTIQIDPMLTLSDLLLQLTKEVCLENPSLSLNGTTLYLKNLHTQYAENLEKCIGELIDSGSMLVANDKNGKTLKILLLHQS